LKKPPGLLSASDLLLEGYRRYGSNVLPLLDGDFAFVIRDRRQENILAARDPFGIRPLYYTIVGGEYRFAASIGALLGIEGVDRMPDHEAIGRYLTHRALAYEETMFAGIRRIPPGHFLEIRGRKRRLERYWFPERIPHWDSLSWTEASERFRWLWERAVRIRVGEVGETAFEVSGGLDSSSVLSTFTRIFPKHRPDAYGMIFPGMSCDESPYLDRLEAWLGIEIRRCDAAGIDYRHRYGTEYLHRLSPWWPVTTTFSMYAPMAERMQAEGKIVVLTGQGGDHLLGGSCHTLSDLWHRRAWRALRKELFSLPRSMVPLRRSCLFPRRTSEPFRSVSDGNVPARPELFTLVQETSPATQALLTTLLSPRESALRDGNLFHAFESEYGLIYRHPFFDKSLVEFVLSLPPEFRHSRGWSKALLRYAMVGILPPEILSRRDKAEFGAILARQLEASEWEGLLKDSRLLKRFPGERPRIEKALRAFRRGRGNWEPLWAVVQMERWYRHTFATL
jgi:asparagine synthase (glutamine-hydrolysing)